MKIQRVVSVLAVLCLLSACSFYEGYTATDGAGLKEYMKPEALLQLTKKPDKSISIIDVRPTKAYSKGHVPTALSFPSAEIVSRLDELPLEGSYIIYCETGIRAQMVIGKLEKKGYTRLMNWGGYKRWPYPLVK
jgi:phage shock protein E